MCSEDPTTDHSTTGNIQNPNFLKVGFWNDLVLECSKYNQNGSLKLFIRLKNGIQNLKHVLYSGPNWSFNAGQICSF